jgi:general secretion pathway protein C
MKDRALLARRALTALSAALALLLLVAILWVVRGAISARLQKSSPAGAGGAEAAAPRGPARAFDEYAVLLRENVFGPPAGELVRLSATDGGGRGGATAERRFMAANLRLWGTVAWPGQTGYAFISGPGPDQKVYREGEDIEGVGRLAAVYPDRVAIETGGGTVELAMVLPGEGPGAGPSGSAPGGASGMGRQPGDVARAVGENAFVVAKEVVQSAFENPRNMMTDARLLPNFSGGVQQGFVMREVRPQGIYSILGLRNGDVLLKVNDFAISDAQAALQAFSALKGMNRVELDILRDGTPQTLTYTVQ